MPLCLLIASNNSFVPLTRSWKFHDALDHASLGCCCISVHSRMLDSMKVPAFIWKMIPQLKELLPLRQAGQKSSTNTRYSVNYTKVTGIMIRPKRWSSEWKWIAATHCFWNRECSVWRPGSSGRREPSVKQSRLPKAILKLQKGASRSFLPHRENGSGK